MPHGGDLVAELLVRSGVTHVFGQPGGQTAALYDGIARRAPAIGHVLVRDERSAAYASDASARLTGFPGVCDVTVGPGATKLADGLVESLGASVPVIALVGELPRDWEPYRDHGVASQGFDQVAFLSSITKATLRVPSVGALAQQVRAAFRIATTARPGPVAVLLPHDVLDAEWEPEHDPAEVDDRYLRAPAFRPLPEAVELRRAADLLGRAERPLIVAGGGVHASRAAPDVTALAERIGAVTATSFSGKGAIEEDSPLAAGVLNPLGSTAALALARRADLVLWCGCKVGQNTSNNWTLPLEGQVTIHLDVDPAELGRTFRPSVALNGDAGATLRALLELLPEQARASWRQEAELARKEEAAGRAGEEGSDAAPILPQRVMRELAGRLRPGDVVVSDASFSAGWVATHLQARRATRDFLFARGQGGLGYALPASLGARLARPAPARVVTVSGDGGFSYGLGELATFAAMGLPAVHVVLNNGSLAWLAMWQRLFFEGLRQSVDLGSASFAGVAEALGCAGFTVTEPGEIGPALDEAFASGRPAVVDVRTDPEATPIHGYRRRLREGGTHPRPGTVYGLPPWRRSPEG
ncbi:MAG: thiamine pyrophosphate-binding protein [Actinomycetota bacterium]